MSTLLAYPVRPIVTHRGIEKRKIFLKSFRKGMYTSDGVVGRLLRT